MKFAASSTAESSATSRRRPPDSSITIRVPLGAVEIDFHETHVGDVPACPRARVPGFGTSRQDIGREARR